MLFFAHSSQEFGRGVFHVGRNVIFTEMEGFPAKFVYKIEEGSTTKGDQEIT